MDQLNASPPSYTADVILLMAAESLRAVIGETPFLPQNATDNGTPGIEAGIAMMALRHLADQLNGSVLLAAVTHRMIAACRGRTGVTEDEIKTIVKNLSVGNLHEFLVLPELLLRRVVTRYKSDQSCQCLGCVLRRGGEADPLSQSLANANGSFMEFVKKQKPRD